MRDINNFTDHIFCEDSESMLKKLPDNFVDIIVTSPPYNFDRKYEASNDLQSWSTYFDKLNKIWTQCHRILKPSGRLCINIQPNWLKQMPVHHIITNQIRDLGMFWKGEILWEKHNYNCAYTTWGSWKSPSMPYLKYSWEFVEVFYKEAYKKVGKGIDITENEFKKWTYAKWEIPPEKGMTKYHHPAMFPEELVYRLLKLFSYTNDIVVDPFNGAGTTSLVALKLKRRYIGIDISEEYCKMAKRRIEVLKEGFIV